jgi:histidinol-phosphatase (PHP family)
MHGSFSDGRGKPMEFAEAGAAIKLKAVGLSDHSPVPLENNWSMKKNRLEDYIKTISEVKAEYGKIGIYTGLELDFIENLDVKGYVDFDNLGLDYHIGAVHYIYSRQLDRYLEVDGSRSEFEFLVNEGFGGDAAAAYSKYYETVRMMVEKYKPPVAAHLDLIVKNNGDGFFFDEDDPRYADEVEKTLDAALRTGTMLEVNTGGLSRGYVDRPYPAYWILDRCRRKGVGVVLNSDAHSPETVGYGFRETVKTLKKTGFERLYDFHGGKWVGNRL